MNRRGDFKKFFGFVPIPTREPYPGYMNRAKWDEIELRMEKEITPLILAAAKEQGVK